MKYLANEWQSAVTDYVYSVLTLQRAQADMDRARKEWDTSKMHALEYALPAHESSKRNALHRLSAITSQRAIHAEGIRAGMHPRDRIDAWDSWFGVREV